MLYQHINNYIKYMNAIFYHYITIVVLFNTVLKYFYFIVVKNNPYLQLF